MNTQTGQPTAVGASGTRSPFARPGLLYERAKGRDVEVDRATEYRAYLRSDVWQRLRVQVLARCGGFCEHNCGRQAIEVHHVRYPKRFGDEPLTDLIAVCQNCHEAAHGRGQLPVLRGALTLKTLSPSGKPFPYQVCENARVWSTLEFWCVAMQIPTEVKARFRAGVEGAAARDRLEYMAESENGTMLYRYHAIEEALEHLEYEYRAEDARDPGKRRWSDQEREAREIVHRNYRALRRWANDLQEQAIAGRLRTSREVAQSGVTPDMLVAALRDAVAPRLHEHDAKIAQHDVVIEAVKQAAPFLRDLDEFISIRQGAVELGLDPAWMPRYPDSRLNVCGLAGKAMTERATLQGPKVATRLDGSGVTAETNTYRRADVYSTLREFVSPRT